MNKKVKDPVRPKRAMVALSILAAERLKSLTHALHEEVRRRPNDFPGYAGRRLTVSDTVNLLYERFMANG